MDILDNEPFLSYLKSQFQREAKYEAIDLKMIFYFHANKTHCHKKDLILKVRVFGTQKWPVTFGSQLMRSLWVLCWRKHLIDA